MKVLNSFFTLSCFFFLTLAHAYADTRQEQIKTILEISGFNKLLQHIPDFSQGVLKQSSGALEPEVNSALSSAFSQAFTTEAVQQDIIKLINTHYDANYADAYIKILQSPLHTRVAQLERDINNPASRNEMLAFIAALENKPADATRTALIERLDKANRSSEFGVDLQATFFKAIFVAVNPVMDADMQISEDELGKMVAEVSKTFAESLRKNTRLTYLYTFRNISDAELTQYIEECESEAYRWAMQMLGNVMISALNQATDRAATIMTHNKQ